MVAIYVAKNGNDVTGDGTAERPFATVQRGFDDVNRRDRKTPQASLQSSLKSCDLEHREATDTQ